MSVNAFTLYTRRSLLCNEGVAESFDAKLRTIGKI